MRSLVKLDPVQLVLPLSGAVVTALVLWRSGLLSTPLGPQDGLLLVALLLPFVFAFHMALGGIRAGNLPRQVAGGVFSVLLGVPAIICLADDVRGESVQLLLRMAPLYLWIVVALMTLVGIAVDTLRNSEQHQDHAL